MARVVLENINKIFDKQIVAASDFNLKVADGEFMVIVGPSGSGKTTILRIIAGLEKPTSGNIYIGNKLVNDIPPKDRDIAMVFQNYALYPHMNVYENIAFPLKMRKLPKEEISKQVKNTSELLGIQHLLTRKPQDISGGQRQRVAVARAIVRKPDLFLFDEPLSNLDAGLRLNTRTEMKALHQKLKATSIYVTHDQTEAMTLGDRVCVIHDGVIQQVDSPMQIYQRPVNIFVAGFFGTPSMNFFTGLIKYIDGIPCFVIGGDTIKLPSRLNTLLTDYSNKEMIMGIRPENLSFTKFTNQNDNVINAAVDVIEPLGTHMDIYFNNSADMKFVASIDTQTPINVNDTLSVYIDLEKIHIFDPADNGKNITRHE